MNNRTNVHRKLEKIQARLSDTRRSGAQLHILAQLLAEEQREAR